MQDLAVYVAKGVALVAQRGRDAGTSVREADMFLVRALFATVTNVNFDVNQVYAIVKEGLDIREALKARLPGVVFTHDAANCSALTIEEARAKAETVGYLAIKDENIRSLLGFLTFGLKGMAAYLDHASVLGYESEEIFVFLERALAATLDEPLSLETLFDLTVEIGTYAVKAMALLDRANTETYGDPEPTDVSLGTREGNALLVTGHDLKDFEEILEQTKDKGVNVYTHGEMLPAHAYPAFKRYLHFAGNYGSSWHAQQKEFNAFKGAIVFTTNCLQRPQLSYADRVFTTGRVRYENVPHIEDREEGGAKDFSPAIEKALSLEGLPNAEGGTIRIGYARHALTERLDEIVRLVQRGRLRRFVLMGGCDGRSAARAYFTEVAKRLPQDAVILTAGCAKYRYHTLDLGNIDGVPRIIDAGQCNDSYSLAVFAMQLQERLGANLPLAFDIAWYEQKAICVLLALLALGFKNVRIGPTLPGFFTPNTARRFIDRFGLSVTTTPDADIRAILR